MVAGAAASTHASRRVLGVYRAIMRTARSWQGGEQERAYILEEARSSFRAHRHLTDAAEIEAKVRSPVLAVHQLEVQPARSRGGRWSSRLCPVSLRGATSRSTSALYASPPSPPVLLLPPTLVLTRSSRKQMTGCSWRCTTRLRTPGCTMRPSIASAPGRCRSWTEQRAEPCFWAV